MKEKAKETIKELIESNEDAAKVLKPLNREGPGKPRIEETQPDLLATISKIVESQSAADPRRRTEILRSVRTLDDMTNELSRLGYIISRSATYLRLQPKRKNTIEGKRHVKCLPIKLLRPEHNLRKVNIDRMYAKSLIDDIHDIDSLFGPDCVTVLSMDDKARIPLGIVAAHLQSPIIMSMEYKVRLLDHDFAVANRHKLIPSVYAECEIKKDGSLSYSGNTFIRIRSGKHDTSNAGTHAYDIRELFDSEAVMNKPILLLETDGAQV